METRPSLVSKLKRVRLIALKRPNGGLELWYQCLLQKTKAQTRMCQCIEHVALGAALGKINLKGEQNNHRITTAHAALPCCSHEPFKWSEAPREADPYHAVQAPDGAASPRWAGGPRPHQGLWQLSSTSLQETGHQKFPEHLSSFCHSSSV